MQQKWESRKREWIIRPLNNLPSLISYLILWFKGREESKSYKRIYFPVSLFLGGKIWRRWWRCDTHSSFIHYNWVELILFQLLLQQELLENHLLIMMLSDGMMRKKRENSSFLFPNIPCIINDHLLSMKAYLVLKRMEKKITSFQNNISLPLSLGINCFLFRLNILCLLLWVLNGILF